MTVASLTRQDRRFTTVPLDWKEVAGDKLPESSARLG